MNVKLNQLERNHRRLTDAEIERMTDAELEEIIRDAGFEPANLKTFSDDELSALAAGDIDAFNNLKERLQK